MSTSQLLRHITNPFATRHLRPGRLQPLTSAAAVRDVSGLIADIDGAGGHGSIVGPHGTGKSTLLHAVTEELRAAGRLAGLIQIRSLGDVLRALRLVGRAAAGQTACLDGWERLRPAGRLAIRILARIRGCRLVVTSHVPTGIGLSVSTTSSLPLLEAIVAALPDHGGLIRSVDLADVFARHGGNLREALADLYDRFEDRARQPIGS